MRRREAIFALGGAATWPLRVRAQQKVPKIGVLRWEGASVAERLEPFRRRLRELGYIEGQNIIVEYRFAEGRTDRAAQLAAEFVRDKVDIIVAISTPVVVAAKNATQSIPIVMVAADALGTGLVASLSRPGGNVTGVSLMQPDLGGKRLEVLKDIVPALSHLAFLGSTRDPAAQQFSAEARVGAERFGIRWGRRWRSPPPVAASQPATSRANTRAEARDRALKPLSGASRTPPRTASMCPRQASTLMASEAAVLVQPRPSGDSTSKIASSLLVLISRLEAFRTETFVFSSWNFDKIDSQSKLMAAPIFMVRNAVLTAA
jgi:hypothetical protein